MYICAFLRVFLGWLAMILSVGKQEGRSAGHSKKIAISCFFECFMPGPKNEQNQIYAVFFVPRFFEGPYIRFLRTKVKPRSPVLLFVKHIV